MKNVLILAYYFPPNNSIGSQRPFAWYKYFFSNGLYPIVITRHWQKNIKSEMDCIKPSEIQIKEKNISDEGTIIKVPFNPTLRDKLIIKYGLNNRIFIRKLLSLVYSFFEFRWNLFDPKYEIFKAAEEYLRTNKVDCIIATGEPLFYLNTLPICQIYFQSHG